MTGGGIYTYVSNAGSGEMFVLRLNPENGDLVTVQRVAVTGKVMPLAVSPDRRFLFAGLRSKPYSIASFAIDPSHGTLTHLANAPAPDSMNYICTDHTGRFLLAALNPQDMVKPAGQLSVSAIGPGGIVQPAHQIITTGRKPHAILPDPSNRYVFSTSLKGDIVTASCRKSCCHPPVMAMQASDLRKFHHRAHPSKYSLSEPKYA